MIRKQKKPEDPLTPARPFVKWVGGKRSIIKELSERTPQDYTGYHECFMGGAALFFALQSKNARLSDVNFHLVLAYQAIRDDVDGVIAELKNHKAAHKKSYFLKARLAIAKEDSPVKVAAVDGGMMLDHPKMVKTLKRFRASVVLPIHWFGETTLGAFLSGMRDTFDVVRMEDSTLIMSQDRLPARPTVIVMPPQFYTEYE